MESPRLRAWMLAPACVIALITASLLLFPAHARATFDGSPGEIAVFDQQSSDLSFVDPIEDEDVHGPYEDFNVGGPLAFNRTGSHLLGVLMNQCDESDSPFYTEWIQQFPVRDVTWALDEDESICQAVGPRYGYMSGSGSYGRQFAPTKRDTVAWLRYRIVPPPNGIGGGSSFHQVVESNADGTNLRLVYEGLSFTHVVASPTANTLYLSTANNSAATNGVYSMDLSSGSITKIISREPWQSLYVLDVSPDGRWLVYSSQTHSRTGIPGEAFPSIRALDLQGGGGTPVILGGDRTINQFAFSPNMEHVAYIDPGQGSYSGSGKVAIADLAVGANLSLGDTRHLDTISNRAVYLAWRATSGAPFTWKRWASQPGRVDFHSLAEDPDGGSIYGGDIDSDPHVPAWDYGDGHTSGDSLGLHSDHVYEKPGEYDVKHTVTSTTNPPRTYSSTQKVTIPAPELEVSVSVDEEAVGADGRIPLDEEFDVTVRVSATSGVGDISDVEFAEEALLEVSVDNVLEFDTSELEVEPFDLEPAGDPVEFVVPATAVRRGDITLTSKVTGTDANGDEIEGEGTRTLKVGHDFRVEVSATPQEIDLEFEVEEGKPKPKPVSMTVTVENVSDGAIEDATLSFDPTITDQLNRNPSAEFPVQLRTYKIGDDPAVPIAEEDEDGIDGIILGDMVIGEQRTVIFTAQAMDAGEIDVDAIARGVVQVAPPRAASGSYGVHISVGQDRLLMLEGDDEAPLMVKANETYFHSGAIRNLSTTKDVTVRILTRKRENVIGEPMYLSSPLVPNPLGIVTKLEPGERQYIRGKFTSHPDGPTRATVEFLVDGWYDDEDCECELQVAPKDLVIASQGVRPTGMTYKADKRVVTIDTSVPPPPTYSYPELGWIFTDSFARGFGMWVDGTAELVAVVGKHTIYAPYYGYRFLEFVGTAAESATVRAEIGAQLYDSYAAVQRISLSEAKTKVDAMLVGKMQPLANAWVTNDTGELTRMSGEFLGGVAPELIIEAAMPALAAKRFAHVRGASMLDEASDAQKASKAGRVDRDGLDGFKERDDIDFNEAAKYWGMDAALDAKLMRYAKDKKLAITMRDRSPGSVERLRQGANPKIEMIKAKNVNSTDTKYLGFNPDHKDLVVIKEMRPWIYYESRLPPGLPADEVAKIKARWEQRTKEFQKESKKYLKYQANGRVPVPDRAYGLNAADNGIKDPKAKIWSSNRFELETVSSPDGSLTYMPKMNKGTAGADFEPFTGDMDLLAITDEAGNILPIERRKEVYKELAAMGFQHPESLTWDNAAGRNGYVGDYDVAKTGSQAMLAYLSNGSRRAVKFDSRHSILDDMTPAQVAAGAFMFIEGLDLTFTPAPVTTGELTYPEDPDDDVPLYFGLSGNGAPAVFSGDPNAPLIRRNADGTFSKWTAQTGWQPWTPPAGTVVASLPQTATTAGTSAGATRIEIHEQGTLSASLGGAPALWFQPGMQIVIDPGGPNEEYATVAALGSIITSTPLRKAHAPGELIGVVPGTWNQPAATVTTPPAVPTPATKPKSGAKGPSISGKKLTVKAKLTCSPGSWSGTAPIRYTFAWQYEKRAKKGKRWVVSWPAITKATKSTYTLTKADLGRKLRCTVTARNAAGSTTRSSAAKAIPKPKAKRTRR